MGTFVALAVATPFFGLALAPPDPALSPDLVVGMQVTPAAMVAAFEPTLFEGGSVKAGGSARGKVAISDAGAEDDGEAGADADEGEEEGKKGRDAEASGADDESEEEEEAVDEEQYAADVRKRAELTKLHMPLGIATYAAMGVTVLLGGIQYYNLYGFGASRGSNPCVTGDAVFGQGQCSGTPWLHLGASLLTTALYSATFVLSVLMPDPDDASEGEGEFAETLRMHKLLRWVHFGGMVAQMLLGAFVANADAFGLDRANDYGTLQALGTVHLGVGLVTFGAMTWAMILML